MLGYAQVGHWDDVTDRFVPPPRSVPFITEDGMKGGGDETVCYIVPAWL